MDLQILKDNFSPQEIMAGNFGIEREALRVNPDGTLAMTKHPEIFGDKLENPYFTTDFSESQLEVVTEAYPTVHRAISVLENMVDTVNNEIREGEELLWPASMPCIAPDFVPIAEYGDSPESHEEYDYRLGLINKYGALKQLLTGIHFNFSFTDTFLKKLRDLTEPDMSLKDFKTKIYLKIARNYLRYRWLIVYLTGSSASMHKSYDCVKAEYVAEHSKDAKIVRGGPSLRNSPCGYKNMIDLFPRFTSLDEYIEDVKDFVDEGLLSKSRELYTQVRLKSGDKHDKKHDVLDSLAENGIEYLEFRTIDLNLFSKAGVSEIDLEFMHLFFLTLLLMDEPDIPNEIWQKEALENENKVAVEGLNNQLILHDQGKEKKLVDFGLELVERVQDTVDQLGIDPGGVLYEMRTRLEKPETTYAASMAEIVERYGYVDGMMRFAKAYSDDSYRFRYLTRGYEDYELSTQILIKEALTRGVKVEEIDPSDNFLLLSKGGKKALVKQATKTEADNYATVLAMENKVVTKKLLQKEGIKVPDGAEFYSLDEFKAEVSKYSDRPVVIKPKSTNFGLGIFIFENGGSPEDLITAATKAFEYDDTILVEEFIPGEEYRFLVIGDRTVAVLKRVPANVVGDGEHTIHELIEIKNQHPFRGEGYSAPMKKIKEDEQTIIYLKNQGLNLESVPEDGQQVFLRGNSNISTGGDSIDVTAKMPERFKREAEKAAKSVNAVFCGVDVMIEEPGNENSDFGIIELNFNPSTDMHAYPMEGDEHRTGAYILSALGLIDTPLEEIKPKKKLDIV